MSNTLLSICIPIYNRIQELCNLLNSIDCLPDKIEIVICEDFSPNRHLIRNLVTNHPQCIKYTIKYHENKSNLGFDGNLRELIRHAKGHFVMFMGDDDLFVPGALNRFIKFLENNIDKSYILRSYLTVHQDGRIEYFHYLPKSQTIPAGQEAVSWLFKRSVSLSGFTISRMLASRFETSELDGTLLYQVYLMSQVCLLNDSIYCDIPFTHAVQSFRNDSPMFGNAEAEKSRFTPGSISCSNSINFTKAYFEVTDYLDKNNSTNISQLVRLDLSKYSYPFLSIQRKRGILPFIRYSRILEVELGFGCTPYFYIYKWALILFGERGCDRIIGVIKRILGYTPNL